MKKWLLSSLAVVLGLSLAGCSAQTSSDTFPSKTIEFVAAGDPGGGIDTTTRAVEQGLKEAGLADQPFQIVNMRAGGGNEAKAYVSNKKDDPYYLYTESNRIYVNKIIGTTELSLEDVTPIARLTTEYLAWVVKADSPYQKATDILDKLKADPTSVEFGVGSIPSNDQFNILRPAMEYGIDPKQIRVISFKSGGDLMTQLLGGHIQVISTSASEALEQAKIGKVRILAISSAEPQGGDYEGIPTWKSMGVDVSIFHWRGIFAPPGISPEVVAYWDDKFGQLVKSDAWKQICEKYGWSDAYLDSAAFKADLEQEREITEKLLTDLGLAK